MYLHPMISAFRDYYPLSWKCEPKVRVCTKHKENKYKYFKTSWANISKLKNRFWISLVLSHRNVLIFSFYFIYIFQYGPYNLEQLQTLLERNSWTIFCTHFSISLLYALLPKQCTNRYTRNYFKEWPII